MFIGVEQFYLLLYSSKFQNNSPFSSNERLDFIEFQDAKLTKNEDFHKHDAADATCYFKGELVRLDIT